MGKKGFILDYSRRLHIAANSHSFAYIHSMACSTLSSVSYYPILIQRTRFKWGEKQQLTPDIRLYVGLYVLGIGWLWKSLTDRLPFFLSVFSFFLSVFFPSPLGIATRRRPTKQNYATVYAYNNSPLFSFHLLCVLLVSRNSPLSLLQSIPLLRRHCLFMFALKCLGDSVIC